MSVCKPCFLVVVAALLCGTAGTLSAQDARAGQQLGKDKQTKTAELLAVIQSNAPMEQKAAAFEELAIYGTSDAIAVVAPMLSDPKWSHYARYALEPLPDPAVDQALRDALKKVKGKLLIGMVNSLGTRRDTEAVGALRELLTDADVGVVSAAACSLGKIADPKGVAALQEALAAAKPAQRAGVAEGCLVCAETLVKEGKISQAVAFYDAVSKARVPLNLRMAGLRGAVVARGPDGTTKLTAILVEGKRPEEVAVALRAARELGGQSVASALLEIVGSLPPDRKGLVLLVLADLQCKQALPIAVAAAESGDRELRVAALRTLKSIGDASVVPVLWKTAIESDAGLADTAREALAALPGKQVDAAIVAHLNNPDTTSKRLAIQLSGRRRIAAARAPLMEMTKQADSPLRLAAMVALGEILPLDQLPLVVQWVARARGGAERAAAIDALKAACIRMPNADACTDTLTQAIASAPFATQVVVLEQLRIVRGAKALQYLAAAAKDPDPKVQDAATRILGTWISPDAAPVLLDLAKTLKEEKYRIRALRGYVRFARQFGFPEAERIAICRNALAAAERNEDRQLILEVLNRYPSIDSLVLAATLLDNPQLQGEAAQVVVTIGEKFVQDDPETVAATMRRVIDGPYPKGVKRRAQAVLNRATEGDK